MLVQNCQVLVVEWSRMKHNRSCSMLQHLSKLIFIDFVFQWPFQKPLRTSTSPKNAPHLFRPEFPYNIEFRAANFQTSMVGHLCWRKNMFYLCTFDDSSSTKKETTRKFTFVGWNVNFWGRKVGWKLLEYNTLCSQVFGTKFERTLQDRCPPCFSKKPYMSRSRTQHGPVGTQKKDQLRCGLQLSLGRLRRPMYFKGKTPAMPRGNFFSTLQIWSVIDNLFFFATDFMGSRMHLRFFRALFVEDSYEQWINGDVISGDDTPEIMMVVVV